MDNYIPIREAVNLTGMCAQTLRKLCDNNEIQYFKTTSGQRKISKKSLEELTRSNDNNVSTSSKAKANKNVEKNINKNILYIHENTENYQELKDLINEKKMFNNYELIYEKNGIKKIGEYCLLSSNNFNIILINGNLKEQNIKEYEFIKHLTIISNNNLMEINLT